MKLHGHTTIELTDVNTGKKRKYEDDNIVTNALQHLLAGGGVFQWNPLTYLFSSAANGSFTKEMLVNTLTRGLMLFDGAIEENVETVKPPAGVGVVGCGSGITYTGNNVMAGSYNYQESGETEDGWKHVWDFSTNQGNGSIACACLTTQAGGKITEGTWPYSDDYRQGSTTDAVINKEDRAFRIPSYSYYLKALKDEKWNTSLCRFSVLHVDGKRNRMLRVSGYEEINSYYFNSTSGSDYTDFQQSIFCKKSIDIDIYRLPLTSMSIFDFNTSSVGHEEMLAGTVTVEMPKGLKDIITQGQLDTPKNYWAAFHSNDEDYIYITIHVPTATGSYTYIDKQDKLYVWKISVEDFSSTYFEVINTTGEKIRCDVGFFGSWKKPVLAYGDFTFVIGESGKMYIINSRDSTDVSQVSFPDGTAFNISDTYAMNPLYFECGKLTFAKAADQDENVLICDTVTKEVRYKNTTLGILCEGSYGGSVVSAGRLHGTCFMIANSTDRYQNSGYLMLGCDPELLVTINNLSSPVVKTASETMKVTYTLTRTDGLEG